MIDFQSIFQELAHNTYFQIWLFMIALDVFTGMGKCFFGTKGSSKIAWKGIFKHLFTVVTVIAFCVIFIAIGIDSLAGMFILFEIGVYGISIVENYVSCDLPTPTWLKRFFEEKKKEGEGETKE